MTINYIEETAKDLELEGEDLDMYESLLEEAKDHAHRAILWSRMLMVIAVIFFMCLMMTAALYFLSLDYDFTVYGGIGLALSMLSIVCFPFFIVIFFYVQKLRALQRTAEAKVLGYLGQFM